MITLTESAKNYLSSVAKDDFVTLGVNGGGCSGFQYVWDYKKNWPDVKWSEPYDDCLVLDPIAEMFVAGCTIDYVTELGGSYLKVINPNATASCGCGESFAVQEKTMEILWTLLLTVCITDTHCINQRVDLFETEEQCLVSRMSHKDLPIDGDWKTVDFICKPLGSKGAQYV